MIEIMGGMPVNLGETYMNDVGCQHVIDHYEHLIVNARRRRQWDIADYLTEAWFEYTLAQNCIITTGARL